MIIRTRFEEIRVLVVASSWDKARLGFEAPEHVTIHREEVQRAVDAEQADAEQGGSC